MGLHDIKTDNETMLRTTIMLKLLVNIIQLMIRLNMEKTIGTKLGCFTAQECVCGLLFVSSLSCCCRVMEALYVLKTFAVRPVIRELRCLFSMAVCHGEKMGRKETKRDRQRSTNTSGQPDAYIQSTTVHQTTLPLGGTVVLYHRGVRPPL